MNSSRFPAVWVALFLLGQPVMAAQFLCPTSTGGPVILPKNQPAKNLYVAGTTVSLKGSVRGDLTAAGGQLEILGPVERDLTAAGGDLRVEKSIGANARLAGGSVQVNGAVGEDLIAVAGRLALSSHALVKGDAVLAGGEIILDGPIQGRAWISGGRVTLNGPITGNTVVHYDGTLTVGSACRLGGKLECYGPKPPLLEAETLLPSIHYHATPSVQDSASRFPRFLGVFGLFGLIRLGAWILAAWILARLLPRPLRAVLGVIETNPWRDFGLGFLIVLVAAVGIPLLFLTVVGYYAGLVAASFLAASLLLARLLAGFYLGILLKNFRQKTERETFVPFRWVAAGILALHLLDLIPVLGWLVSCGLGLLSLGAMSRLAYEGAALESGK